MAVYLENVSQVIVQITRANESASMADEFASLDKLSDGIANMPRRMTARERRADSMRYYLLVGGRVLILPAAVLGFALRSFIGCAIGAGTGWIAGIWVRRSLGVRGKDGFHGWFQRIRERANGSRTGLLEYLIEAIRGSGLTIEKSRMIIAAYDEAMAAMKSASTDAEREAVAVRLDIETKRISYTTPP